MYVNKKMCYNVIYPVYVQQNTAPEPFIRLTRIRVIENSADALRASQSKKHTKLLSNQEDKKCFM